MISFFPHIPVWRSTLQNLYLSPLTSNWAIKPQYEKVKKSPKTFIHRVKHHYHNRVLKIRLEHKCARLGSVLCSHGKKGRMFFSHNSEWSDSEGLWKITHWYIYPLKIKIFGWVDHYQFIGKVTPVFCQFTATLLLLSHFFSHKSLLKSLLEII